MQRTSQPESINVEPEPSLTVPPNQEPPSLNKQQENILFELYKDKKANLKISTGEKFRLYKRRETIRSIRFLRKLG